MKMFTLQKLNEVCAEASVKESMTPDEAQKRDWKEDMHNRLEHHGLKGHIHKVTYMGDGKVRIRSRNMDGINKALERLGSHRVHKKGTDRQSAYAVLRHHDHPDE